MNKPDLALNNLQWLICHKTKPNSFYSHRLAILRLENSGCSTTNSPTLITYTD